MNTIEIMLEALKSCTEDADGQHFHQTQVNEAITLGEAELKREPVAWGVFNKDDGAHIYQQKETTDCFGESTALYSREEIK